ncbi:ankyrin repeat-containing domain protein [Peziza echinospora]|nr:ankyrin repeat-containing domain protein [Peziza echinospora]
MASADEFVVVDKTDLNDYNEAGILPAKPEEIAKLHKWLEPTDYAGDGGELNKNQNQYTQYTGGWLKQSPEYRELMSVEEGEQNIGLLWIQGIPGSGKSVIAARLVSEFAAAGIPVCYFFFREIIQANRSEKAMVVDWLAQLATIYPPCAQTLLKLSQEESSIGNLSTPVLWKIFTNVVSSMPKLMVVVDALDEMDLAETASCLSNLSALAMEYTTTVKIIATSRPNPEIQNGFKPCTSSVSVSLTSEKIDSDIACYASHRLKDAGMSAEEQSKCIKSLLARGKGIFLYVKLMLDELLNDELGHSTDSLPHGIAEMYDHLLEKHRKASGATIEKQILVLQAVIFASGTPSLTMLAHIYNIDLGEKGLEMAVLDTKAMLRRICGPLLDIKNDVVHIVHHSFTEYLTNKGGVRGTALGSFPVLTAKDAHRALSDVCLTYLNFEYFKKEGVDLRPSTSGCCVVGVSDRSIARRAQYPLSQYAINNWGYHARLGEVDNADTMAKMTAHLEAEANVFTQFRGDNIIPYPDKFTPLHMAATNGITAHVVRLIEQGADIEATDSRSRTPLLHAAIGGHCDVLEVLRGHGADIDATDPDKWTALHFAASNGHHAFVRRLIDLGMAPNPEAVVPRHLGIGYPASGWYQKCNSAPPIYTPVRLAIQNGHALTVAEILPHLQPSDALCRNPRGDKRKTILHYAAGLGHADIMGAILGAGLVLPDECDSKGRTPLVCAIQGDGTAAALRVLLEHGASPHPAHPLHACAARDDFRSWQKQTAADVKEIASGLLAAGADVNGRDGAGETPTMVAARGNASVLQWLLQHGGDVHARSADGRTALHRAESVANMKALLRAGADPNAQDRDGNTPLLAMRMKEESDLQYWWPQILTELMAHGASPYVPNAAGETAFHYGDNHSPLELAAVPGIDLNARDKRGRTILHLHTSIHGFGRGNGLPPAMDVDAQDSDGNTALHVAATADQVLRLVRAGADMRITNQRGQTALHTLLGPPSTRNGPSYSSNSVLTPAVMEGMWERLDVNARDAEGNTAVHVVAKHWASKYNPAVPEMLDELAARGCDLSARTAAGKTALHHAAQATNNVPLFIARQGPAAVHDTDYAGRTALHYAAASSTGTGLGVQQLLEAGADPMVRDRDGRTALHFAAVGGQANAVLVLVRHAESQTPQMCALLINARDYKGSRPLHDAAQSGSYATVRCMLQAGAEADVQTDAGRTPLHSVAAFQANSFEGGFTYLHSGEAWRQRPRTKDIARALLAAGVNPGHQDKRADQAAHKAAVYGNVGVVEAIHEWAVQTDVETEKDLVAWASQHTRGQPGTQAAMDSEFALIMAAMASKDVVNAAHAMAAAKGARVGLWQAASAMHEKAFLALLAGDYDYGQPPEDGDSYTPLPDELSAVSKSFERQVIVYLIRQGWLAVLPAAIARFGLHKEHLTAVVNSRDPNTETLELLLPLVPGIQDADWLPENAAGVYLRSALPWHPDAVLALLRDGRTTVGPAALHRALGAERWGGPFPGAWAAASVRALLARPDVDVNATDASDGEPARTPLVVAAGIPGRNTALLEAVIAAGADVHLGDPLSAAAKTPAALRTLLAAGTRLPANAYGALRRLCMPQSFGDRRFDPGALETLAIFLAAGADVDALSQPPPRTPDEDEAYARLWGRRHMPNGFALPAGHTGIPLLEGWGLDKYYVHEPHTVLHEVAAFGCHRPILEALLEHASLDSRDASGRTPLIVACFAQAGNTAPEKGVTACSPIGVLLLEAGADPLAVDNAGLSALDCLLLGRTPAASRRILFDALLSAGAAAAPSKFATILFALTSQRFEREYEAFEAEKAYTPAWSALQLLRAGVDGTHNARDKDGNTAMHVFLPWYLGFIPAPSIPLDPRSRHPAPDPRPVIELDTQELFDEIFQRLIDASGPSILFMPNNKGESPLHIALRKNSVLVPHAFTKVMSYCLGQEFIRDLPPTLAGRTLLHAIGEADIRGESGDRMNVYPFGVSKSNDRHWWFREAKRNRRVDATGKRQPGRRGRFIPGGDPVQQMGEEGPTAMLTRDEVFEYFMANGVDVAARDENGQTALELASLMGHENLVEAFAAV